MANADMIYELMKKAELNSEDLLEFVKIRTRELPAYEAIIQMYLSEQYCTAEVHRTDGIKEPNYSLIGYDKEAHKVFVQAKTGPYGSSKNQEVSPLTIEEFIFGPYKIWNEVDPKVQYYYLQAEHFEEDLPF